MVGTEPYPTADTAGHAKPGKQHSATGGGIREINPPSRHKSRYRATGAVLIYRHGFSGCFYVGRLRGTQGAV
jgi:hypothetical protein